MKNISRILLLLCLALLCKPFSSRAYQISGGEIMYKNLGGDSFLVTVNVYYDCAGANPGSTLLLSLTSGSKALTTFKVNLKKSKNVTNFYTCNTCSKCDSANSTCKNLYGFMRNTYTGIINLSSYKYCEYTIGYSDTSRSYLLTTGGNSQKFYISAFLNKCYAGSSPVFNTFPQIIIPTNVCMDMRNSATDPDSDSLVYKLDSCMIDANKPITFSKPYAYNLPLKFDSFPRSNAIWNPPLCEGFHLNSADGTVNFKSLAVDATQIAIRIEKWRNISGKWVRIGIIKRDIEIVVIRELVNYRPILSGINGTTQDTIRFIAGRKDSFLINSNDLNKNDTVTLSWITPITGDTISVEIKKQHPKLFFDWTPTSADVNTTPYNLTVYADDNSCPDSGRTAHQYYIFVDSNITTGIGRYTVSEDELKIFPNPSKQDFTINYSLNQNGNVLLEVYDVTGRKISTLVSEQQSQGLYKTKFEGSQATDGIYILKGKIGDRFVERRMVLMK